jgi:S1-C subfamily serine protease
MKRVLTILFLLVAAPLVAAEDAKPAPAKPAPEAKDTPRFVPSMKDGKPYGVKIYAIKPGSRFAVQGYLNGDTLVAVDGQSVNDKATEATFREVVVEGTRGGKVDLDRQGKRMSLTVAKVDGAKK